MAEIAAKDAPNKPIEVRFQDEARIGQKNKITCRWAKRSSRPSAPSDQRTASTYIFGAICPARGVGAGLVLPWCISMTMGLHLAEISQAIATGAHAVVLLDQAGWHTSAKLKVPANITLLPLPPKSPEPDRKRLAISAGQLLVQPGVRLRTPHRGSLLRRLEQTHQLIEQPWTIMSIGLRDWAHGF